MKPYDHAIDQADQASRRSVLMATRDRDVPVSNSGAATGVLVREGSYGTRVLEVEPGGAEFIPLNERHGNPLQLFWTWTSPNMEFATIFVGVLAVAGFGLGFWEAALALILGSAIGGVTQGFLSLRGPKYGVPQIVLSRLGFGYGARARPSSRSPGARWWPGASRRSPARGASPRSSSSS